MEYLYFLARISTCFILGIIIGIERQCRRKIAGVRTITLVTLGAFLFVSIAKLIPTDDGIRLAAQVISGIGFLGAGVILRDGTNIRGLNTAATLWCSAAIGTLTALGLIVEAIIGVAYILLSNLLLRFVSRKMMQKTSKKDRKNYVLLIYCELEKEMIVKNLLIQKLKAQQNVIRSISSKKIEEQVKIEVQLETMENPSSNMDSIVNRICIEPGVISVEYDKLSNYTNDDDDDYEIK